MLAYNPPSATGLDLVFPVEAIEALFEDFKVWPVNMVQPLREMPYSKEFYIAGPDSYVLGFIENE